MKLEEFQAKARFARFGIPVQQGIMARSPEEAVEAADELGYPVVVKAQVRTGGRGKAGGVKLAATPDEVRAHAGSILGMNIKGNVVERLLIDPAVKIVREYYAGITVDRRTGAPVLMASASGGVDIEQVACTKPDSIVFQTIDPERGLRPFQARAVALKVFHDPGKALEAAPVLENLWRCFQGCDASLAEINPLVETDAGNILALDAKIETDDNALFRHPDLESERLVSAEEERELKARALGLSYVRLEGDIGCIVNGAGLAMCTLDTIVHLGGRPANFLDIGGSSSPGKAFEAVRLILSDPGVKVLFINVFGGITRCDDVARGLTEALERIGTALPVVIRLTGTNEDEGRRILEEKGFEVLGDMTEGARRAIRLAGGEEGSP